MIFPPLPPGEGRGEGAFPGRSHFTMNKFPDALSNQLYKARRSITRNIASVLLSVPRWPFRQAGLSKLVNVAVPVNRAPMAIRSRSSETHSTERLIIPELD